MTINDATDLKDLANAWREAKHWINEIARLHPHGPFIDSANAPDLPDPTSLDEYASEFAGLADHQAAEWEAHAELIEGIPNVGQSADWIDDAYLVVTLDPGPRVVTTLWYLFDGEKGMLVTREQDENTGCSSVKDVFCGNPSRCLHVVNVMRYVGWELTPESVTDDGDVVWPTGGGGQVTVWIEDDVQGSRLRANIVQRGTTPVVGKLMTAEAVRHAVRQPDPDHVVRAAVSAWQKSLCGDDDDDREVAEANLANLKLY